MNVTDIVQSTGWKNFMAKLYGLGASVVILGALFKIQHWTGSGLMLTLGMSTEAIIFFFSAFEPLHEELDWTLVYPELAGMADPDEIEQFKESSLVGTDRPIDRIEEMMVQSGIDDQSLKKLGEGLQKLNQAAAGIADISQATVATQSFVNNLQGAADSINTLKESYSSTGEGIKDSANSLSSAYSQAAAVISKSGADVAQSYQEVASAIQNEQSTIVKGSKAHETQLEALNKNLSALNTVYELQIKGSNEHLKGSEELYSGLHSMVSNLKSSVEETDKYKNEVVKLRDNLSSLNNIYGNMLSSMNMLTK